MAKNYNTRMTLIAKIQDQQDERSWEEFIYFYEGYIFLVVKNLGVDEDEIKDLVQTVLLTLWESLPTFNYEPGKSKFRTWMTTVIRNKVYSHFRTVGRYRKRMEKVAEGIEDEGDMPDIYKVAEDNWKAHISNLAWEKIRHSFSEIGQESFLLFAKGKSAQEIADETNQKLNTVYVTQKKIVHKLSREIRLLQEDLS